MQTVAASLGFTTMSLYRYVSSKEELLQLMQDAALSIPEEVRLPDGWREGLRTWALMVREVYRSHPWALEIPRGQAAVLMPNSVRAADLGVGALEDLDIDDEAKLGVILVISQLAASMVELERSLADEGMLAANADGAALLSDAVTSERFPHVHRLYALESRSPAADAAVPVLEGATLEVDDEFMLGVDLLLDGLEKRRSRSRQA